MSFFNYFFILFVVITTILQFSHAENDLPKPRIVGGVPAAEFDYPFQVSIQIVNEGHFCGGALITASKVLTAAHCMFDEDMNPINEQKLAVYGGSIYLADKGAVLTMVNKIVIHGDYDQLNGKGNDIALLILEQDVPLSQSLNTISLLQRSVNVGEICVVTGWGLTSEDGFRPEMLMKVEVPIYDLIECAKNYGPHVISTKMICAGLPEGGKDSCQGDSGGPLVCEGHLAGVVSFGIGCAESSHPGVYTRISDYITWIERNCSVCIIPSLKNVVAYMLIVTILNFLSNF